MEKRQNIFSVREDDRLVFVVSVIRLHKNEMHFFENDILSRLKELNDKF